MNNSFNDNNFSPSTEEQKKETVTYRWSYGEQVAHDQSKQKNTKGALPYVLAICSVFLLCILILSATLIWQGGPSRSHQGALTTGEVSQMVTPATVLISTYNQNGPVEGTGFFLRSDGYIVTNYHIFKDCQGYPISVTLYTGETLTAQLLGYLEAEDVAVLKIGGNDYPSVMLGDSDTVLVGDVAIAIGNPGGSTAPWSTTQGIISATDRIIAIEGEDYYAELTVIQTDAPVSKGNSGGPLCNDRGEVVGMVSHKINGTEGVGLVLPINGVMEIAYAIIEEGSAESAEPYFSRVRPKLGIVGGIVRKGETKLVDGNTYTAPENGILITEVDPNGDAADLLLAGDLITAVDGERIFALEDLTEALYGYQKGDTVLFTVYRGGKTITVSILIGKG